MRGVCKVDGCDKPCKGFGYCSKHYQRFARHGAPVTLIREYESRSARGSNSGSCSEQDCEIAAYCRTLCVKHYKRWLKHGRSSGFKFECVICHTDTYSSHPRRRMYCTKCDKFPSLVLTHNLRARRLGLVADLTTLEWVCIVQECGGACYYCGQLGNTLAHLTPLCRGGGTTATNVALTCAPCNQAQLSLTAQEFIELCRTITLHQGLDPYDEWTDQ